MSTHTKLTFALTSWELSSSCVVSCFLFTSIGKSSRRHLYWFFAGFSLSFPLFCCVEYIKYLLRQVFRYVIGESILIHRCCVYFGGVFNQKSIGILLDNLIESSIMSFWDQKITQSANAWAYYFENLIWDSETRD